MSLSLSCISTCGCVHQYAACSEPPASMVYHSQRIAWQTPLHHTTTCQKPGYLHYGSTGRAVSESRDTCTRVTGLGTGFSLSLGYAKQGHQIVVIALVTFNLILQNQHKNVIGGVALPSTVTHSAARHLGNTTAYSSLDATEANRVRSSLLSCGL